MPAPTQTWARVHERAGAIFSASMLVLLSETVTGGIGLVMWSLTQESPVPPFTASFLGWVFLVLLMVFAAVIVPLGNVVLSAGVVPLVVVLAGWAGRRFGGREAWYWVPMVAAVVLLPVPGALSALGTGVLAALVIWLVGTAGIAIAALVARRLLLPGRPHLTGGVMFLRVGLWGTLAVVTVFVLSGIGLCAGMAYEPPRLTRAGAVGAYSDGKGGTLTLMADGKATARGVRGYGGFREAGEPCDGIGSWSFSPGRGPWDQTVEAVIEGCPDFGAWSVFGSGERPKLFISIGDPDSMDFYVLERGAPAGA
ncbi:hypothetical protein ACGFRB_01700 [Streptomyces sp. NPDC048718]|uniref:hypothetical protein n=1 Tax=Streptomyces sp. NPDC048718 TaxID=3365587 RepID=UPI00371C627B